MEIFENEECRKLIQNSFFDTGEFFSVTEKSRIFLTFTLPLLPGFILSKLTSKHVIHIYTYKIEILYFIFK